MNLAVRVVGSRDADELGLPSIMRAASCLSEREKEAAWTSRRRLPSLDGVWVTHRIGPKARSGCAATLSPVMSMRSKAMRKSPPRSWGMAGGTGGRFCARLMAGGTLLETVNATRPGSHEAWTSVVTLPAWAGDTQ